MQSTPLRDRCCLHLHRPKIYHHYEYPYSRPQSCSFEYTPRLSTVRASFIIHSIAVGSLELRQSTKKHCVSRRIYTHIISQTWQRYKEITHRPREGTSMARKIRDGLHSHPERVAWHDQPYVCKKHLRVQTPQARHDQACPDLHLIKPTIPRSLTADLLPNNHPSNISILSSISTL